ncbi:MAG: DUF1127 domain-containing protein, partial [Dongiaceae bacterium]
MSQTFSSKSNSFHVHERSAPAPGWIGGLLLALSRALLRWARHAWTMHCDERLLQELSDHQLRDLGIHRGQISHIVRN